MTHPDKRGGQQAEGGGDSPQQMWRSPGCSPCSAAAGARGRQKPPFAQNPIAQKPLSARLPLLAPLPQLAPSMLMSLQLGGELVLGAGTLTAHMHNWADLPTAHVHSEASVGTPGLQLCLQLSTESGVWQG